MSLTTKSFILAAMTITFAVLVAACGDNPEVVIPLEPAAEQPSPDASTPLLEDDASSPPSESAD